MAHLDLHEQEQLNKLKYFWRDWGNYLIGIIIVVIVVYLSTLFWASHNESQAAKASVIYEQFTNSIEDDNKVQVYALAKRLETEFPKVEYTAMASIWAAKIAWSNKDHVAASSFLTWVIDHAKDKGLIDIARLRLAAVYIDQKKFDKALGLLMSKHDSAFDALYYIERGDLYVARDNLGKARDTYKEALQKAGQNSEIAQAIQLKLDVLGGN